MVLLWFCFFESIAIAYFYGINKFYEDIREMVGYKLYGWFKYCWLYFTPLCTMVIKLLSNCLIYILRVIYLKIQLYSLILGNLNLLYNWINATDIQSQVYLSGLGHQDRMVHGTFADEHSSSICYSILHYKAGQYKRG